MNNLIKTTFRFAVTVIIAGIVQMELAAAPVIPVPSPGPKPYPYSSIGDDTPSTPTPTPEPEPEPKPYPYSSIGDDTTEDVPVVTTGVTPIVTTGGTPVDNTDDEVEEHELPELDQFKIAFSDGLLLDGNFSITNGDCGIRFDLIEVDEAGNEIKKVMSGDPSQFDIDFTKLTREDPVALYKIGATISNSYGKVARVISSNTLGAMRCDNTAKKMAISIPFGGTNNAAITAMHYIRTETLSVNDKMTIYNEETCKQDTYYVNSAKEWAVMKVLMVGAGETAVHTPPPCEKKMERGFSVWLQRQDTSKPVYLVGEYDGGEVDVPVSSGTKDAPSWNLVGSPSITSYDLNTLTASSGVGANDVIIVERDGHVLRYTYQNGCWGYSKRVVTTLDNGNKVESFQRVEDDTVLPPGTGFWYVSAGGRPNLKW